MPHHIQYSDRYLDDTYEYRHVILPTDIAKITPKGRLLTEAEWRGLGVQQSKGWIHYAIHRPEPHILLFRRPINAENVPIKLETKPDVQEDVANDVTEEAKNDEVKNDVTNDVTEEAKNDEVKNDVTNDVTEEAKNDVIVEKDTTTTLDLVSDKETN